MFDIDVILQEMDPEDCDNFMPSGQNCSTPLIPGIYADTITLPIPELSSVILNLLKGYKSLKIELTLMDSQSNELACLWTDIDINVPDGENNGMRMFYSNFMLGTMLLLIFLYI